MSFSATPFSRHFSGLPIIRAAVLAAMIAPVFLVTSRLAVAINFDVVYDSGKSNAPATDASGTDLTAIVEAAAAHWADLIEDDWEMKINIWYDTPAAVGGNTAIAPIVNDNTDGTRTGSMLDFSDGQLTAEALFLNAGSTVNWTGSVLSANNVVGDLDNDAGTIAPGASAGRTGVFGSYTQSNAGTLEIGLRHARQFGGIDRSVRAYDNGTASALTTLRIGVRDVRSTYYETASDVSNPNF